MAARLAVNQTGRLTAAQRRVALIAGLGALAFLMCPLSLLVQLGWIVIQGDFPLLTLGGLLFGGIALLFLGVFAGLVGTNVVMFLPEAFGKRPVRCARGPLEIHMSAKERPELPFSYIIGDYSFAPYVAPPDVPMRIGAPYLVYYAARSRVLLSLAALDAPDAVQWEPEFDPHAKDNTP